MVSFYRDTAASGAARACATSFSGRCARLGVYGELFQVTSQKARDRYGELLQGYRRGRAARALRPSLREEPHLVKRLW